MIDSFGRQIDYLRVSVTKRCNLKCVYCTDECEKANDELSAQQIEKIVRAFVYHGIRKVRLTGGEPLVRRDIVDIARRISAIDGVKKLAITTNGVNLKKYALELKNAGVNAVNVSLDTTDKNEYIDITGRDCLDEVFEGIDEALRVGLSPVRINAVLIKGRNDGRAEELINLAKENRIDVRFIELMPFTAEGEKEQLVVTGEELLQKFSFLKPFESNTATPFEKSVARYYVADGFKGRIGFITPVSNKFCSECNRIRLLSDGKIRACLGSNVQFDILGVIDDEAALRAEIEKAILSKPQTHEFACGYGSFHGMNKIGG